MDVAQWLRSLGLGKYEAMFRDNEIDVDVLPDLTDLDLEKLGVPLGPRKKLLRAIADLPSKIEAAPVARRMTAGGGERRQLTVMFCDLVGSTTLAARLDPEDMVEIIRDFQTAVAAAAVRFDGHVAKWLGDGALVYFGYPRAHEDDAVRAAHAGLALAATGALRPQAVAKLDVRVGIATGLVFVGEVTGMGGPRVDDVVGETPNLAARLQALAKPGTVVVAETTRRLLGGVFELEPMGPQIIAGFAQPTPVWTVKRERANIDRFEASRRESATPLVGRDVDAALLAERWGDARGGDGQVVLLSGEAGIGKSRILANLREKIGGERHFALSFQCSPHHTNEAFYPVLGPIWRAAGFVSDEPSGDRLDKLQSLIERAGLDVATIAPVLAALFSIPSASRYVSADAAPSETRERSISALIALFESLTKNAPVLAILEDAHWADPSSLDLFGRFIDRLHNLPVLLVVTFRPDFVAPWQGRANVTFHSLHRIGRRHAMAMIESLTGHRLLPDDVVEQILAKTDGVPLFVEELTKTVLESGLITEEAGGWAPRRAFDALAIPSTLHDSLMARLDRLAPAREVAQIGAAIGREFSRKLIETVAPMPRPELESALHQLEAAELIYRRNEPHDAIYVFKHALVQDAAHGSLLRGRRQAIHADIARALSEGFADQVEAAPAVVAFHFAEAGMAEKATLHWLKATEQAMARSAYIEANRHVDAGLAQLQSLEDGQTRQSLELALQLARANALLPLRGYDARETMAALNRAKQLLDLGGGDDLQRFSVLYGLCAGHFFAARVEPSHTLASQIVDFAAEQENTAYKLVGHRLLGTTLALMGRNREALKNFEAAERFRNPKRERSLSYRFGNDPGIAVLAYKAWTLIFLGRLDDASAVAKLVETELSDHPHAPTVAFGRFFTTVLPAIAIRDDEALERASAELIQYCTEKRIEQFRLSGLIYQALARLSLVPDAERLAAADAAFQASQHFGGHFGDSDCFAKLAEASLTLGDLTRAESYIARGLAFIDASGERFHLANLRRIQALFSLAGADPDKPKAEALLREAIDIAREQEVRLYELRAATDLARLWRGEKTVAELRGLMEPAIALVRGGAIARDVIEAQALLATLCPEAPPPT